jgi:UDP-2-acetamido-3-amino-2,3-dideoxy-glucuronate N-acetyltransferase
MNYFKHETAVIDEPVEIGEGTKIWHFSHISANAKIGNNVVIGQNVFVGKGVVIGNGCKIQNNVSIYEGLTLEENVFCGPSCVFTNVYNPRSEIIRKSEYKKTLVKKGATVGANCTIICGITVGSFAFIGAGSLIRKNVLDYALMVGVPAKQIGWMSKNGYKLDLPLVGNAETICKYNDQK